MTYAVSNEQRIDYANLTRYLCVHHILELDAKLIEESSGILTTVMHDLDHIHILKYGSELLKESTVHLEHVKQVTCVVNKHLQAASSLRHDPQCPGT